jgi:flavodoxin
MAAIGFGIAMAACSQNKKGDKEMKEEATVKTDNDGKILVAYFSATGTTKKAAEQLAGIIGGDLYEIVPEQPYSDADLDWHNDQSRSSIEMKDLTSRPAIKGTVENLADYTTVYIGFPVWWYTAPTIINTFIEKNDLKGKTVSLFATSGGSTIEKADSDMKAAYPELNWKPGKLLNSIDEKEIREWTK